MKLYVTRDKDKALVLANKKLKKSRNKWDLSPNIIYEFINLPDSWFKGVKWTDKEPTQVDLMIPK